MRAIPGDQAPAADDRPGLDVAAVRLDAADLAVHELDPRTAQPVATVAPCRRAPAAYPARPPPGSAWPSSGEKVAASTPSSPASGERRFASSRDTNRLGTPCAFCTSTASLEGLDVLPTVEQEEVADPFQVDLRPRPCREAGEGIQAPQPERDVQRIRELRPDAAGGSARGARRELGLLEQNDADARLGEMERGTRADHASPDDDGVGPPGQAAHLRTAFRRKNTRFAGRSARRRMKYGYQSGP
jgi:hypothetical protein